MPLIIYFFIDHGFIDDACAEEDAFKDGFVHLPVFGIRRIIYGYLSLLKKALSKLD